jgi:L-ribulose-5-phosphate 4-epimerase
MTERDLVAVDLDGRVLEGKRRPSSDLPTHLALYRAFDSIGGVVHAHSHYATVWAQAGREIPCFGTTHADHFHGPVPVVAHLSEDEVESDYEANTGHAIVRRFMELDHRNVPAALLAGHAPFCWGPTVADALDTMTVLEEVARLAYDTVVLNAAASPIRTASATSITSASTVRERTTASRDNSIVSARKKAKWGQTLFTIL